MNHTTTKNQKKFFKTTIFKKTLINIDTLGFFQKNVRIGMKIYIKEVSLLKRV